MSLDRLVADATIAAYAVALELRETNSWVDLQLGLWDAMARTIRDWAGLRLQVPCRECPYRDSERSPRFALPCNKKRSKR